MYSGALLTLLVYENYFYDITEPRPQHL